MNYRELLYNKDSTLVVRKDFAIILNKYENFETERVFFETGEKRKTEKNGLSKAIVINQLNYWLDINRKSGKNYRDGHYWAYNTYQQWVDVDFPFWSVDTVKRIFTSLEKIGIVLSTSKYNKFKLDKTKWYTIDYNKLQEIIDIVEEDNNDVATGQDAPFDGARCTDRQGKMPSPTGQDAPSNTIDYTENTTNTTTDKETCSCERKSAPPSPLDVMLDNVFTEENLLLPNDVEGRKSELKEIIEYFFRKYMETYRKTHRKLTEESLRTIADEYLYPDDDEYNIMEDVYTFEDYKPMIDLYFMTQYRVGIEKSLFHFMSGLIRRNLKAKLIE